MTIPEAVDAFEEAVRAHAFKGAQMPEDHAGIERAYEKAKRQLFVVIRKVRDSDVTSAHSQGYERARKDARGQDMGS